MYRLPVSEIRLGHQLMPGLLIYNTIQIFIYSARARDSDDNVLVERGVVGQEGIGRTARSSVPCRCSCSHSSASFLINVGPLLERQYRVNPLQLWGPPLIGPGVCRQPMAARNPRPT